jgi:hypothetical protein
MKLKAQQHSKKIVSFINEQYPDHKDDILLADGFDKAFLGIGQSFNGNPVAIYCSDKCIRILMQQFSESDDPKTEAIEYFDYNVIGSYVGEFTPIFMNRLV